DQQHPGSFSVKLKMPKAASGNQTPDAPSPNADAKPPTVLQELSVQTEGLPLAMLAPVFDRAALKMRLAGRLSSRVDCRWSAPSFFEAMAVEGTVTAEDLVLAADFLGPDQVELDRLHVTCKVARQAGRVEVDRLDVESDAGTARITGMFAINEETAKNVLAWLPAQTFELEGRLDLARLAAMLPGTLRIREGTEVTSGRFELSAASERGPQGMNWRARIEAGNLAAVNQGRQLVWQQPVLIHLAARETPQGPIVESLKCDSNFLKLHAAGTLEQLDASASFDLSQLAGQLGQFVDLGNTRLAGDGWAQFNWQRSEAKDFQTDGELQVRNFELALEGQPSAAEESLILSLAATGRTDFTADTQVSTAALTLTAGSERVEVRLKQPVLDLRAAAWPVEVRSTGQLARLSPRLRPWIAMDDWNLAGSYELAAEAIGSKTAVDVRQARLTVAELEIQGPGWHVVEPQAELTVAGAWDGNRRRLELGSATLTTSGLSAQASNIVSTLPAEGPPELSGTLTYRGSLDRLRQWMADPENPSPWNALGQFTGTAEVRHTAGATAATFETTLRDLVATHASGRQIHEAEIRLSGRGAYQPESRSFVVEQAALTSSTLAVKAGGQIALGDGRTDLQLTGQVDYDMERITELLVPYVGGGLQLAGRGSSPVSYRGPLGLDAAQAQAGLGWMRAEAYGFLVGPGELQARLAGGTLDIRPIELDVSEGRARLASQVRLAPEPMELYVEPGRVAERVRINPRMCASALQYVAPILAGVATAEGHFSIELDGCRIPLENPAQGELSGRMIIHSAQVGPGPLVRELAMLLGHASPAQLSRESIISFRMVDGRIYHRDLEFVFPDLVVRTHGSVGLDQSLKIIAEMPIPPKWRGTDELVNSALRDQTIQVPINGTLSKPKIDQKALERLSRRFLEKAAQNVLEDGLNQGLQQLFGPPR
ncbi:MAG: hypothetical protein ABIP48_13660, partial [Planctomycetota bacterium]